ncbi:histidine kinase [Nocardia callitridis]|uniref:histidine kinase n=1 Tax=Nocardia callitridis TaxID=648753 RepID=A0ABP9KRM5_9NOCA
MLVLTCAALTALTLFGEIQSGSGGDRLWLDVVVGFLACGVLAGVERWPRAVTLTLAGLAAVAWPVTAPSTAVVIVVARRQPPAVVAVAATAGVVGHAVYGLWRPIPELPYYWWLLLVVLTYAALVGWGLLVRARHALIDSLRERARRAESEQGRRVAEARAAERAALAREMHDVLAHRLSLVATYAGALEYREDMTSQQVSSAAGVIRSGVHQALGELRDVIAVLRADDESPDRPQPGLTELAELITQARAANLVVELDDRVIDKESVPAAVARTGYRVVQEGLTNARKHAAGAPVRVVVAGAPGAGLSIEVSNPTIAEGSTHPGLASLPGTGTGLVGLTERARLTGGTLDHELTETGEFRMRASLPWPG